MGDHTAKCLCDECYHDWLRARGAAEERAWLVRYLRSEVYRCDESRVEMRMAAADIAKTIEDNADAVMRRICDHTTTAGEEG